MASTQLGVAKPGVGLMMDTNPERAGQIRVNAPYNAKVLGTDESGNFVASEVSSLSHDDILNELFDMLYPIGTIFTTI